MNRLAKGLTVLLVVLLTVQFALSPPVHAQEQPTLADTINLVLNTVGERNSSWNVIYDQIFCRQNTSVFDNAIRQAQSRGDYQEVVFIARLAELNNYTSPTIAECLTATLQSIPMCGTLPLTYNNPNSFLLYDRYMVNAYRYAQNLNVSGWDINSAFTDMTEAYASIPKKSDSGEMLWINPQEDIAESYSSRYYDEHAETLSMFLLLALSGINDAMPYADDAWLGTQSHWNGAIYGYTGKDAGVECEMGNFAQVIAQYRNSRGDIPYFDRVVLDLENTLLVNEYNSTAWGSVGVIKHAQDNPQKRLLETTGNLIALQMLYPYFTNDSQTRFQNMLQTGWKGLVNSSLCSNYTFSFMDKDALGTPDGYTDEASMLGAMTLFLNGIVPKTGSLAINASNERYQDYRTCFPTAQWRFDYETHSIRLPINKGELTFIFGSQNVTQDFPEDGVYDIEFSSDWNNITSTSRIADITHPTLEPVTLQTVPKQPSSTLTPTSTLSTHPPPPKATSSPTPEATSNPTPTAEPSDEPQETPTATPTNDGENTFPLTQVLVAALTFSVAAALSIAALRYIKARSAKRIL